MTTSREVSWLQLVMSAWGEKWNVPETSYEFSNGRRFDSTDRTDQGIYEPPGQSAQ